MQMKHSPKNHNSHKAYIDPSWKDPITKKISVLTAPATWRHVWRINLNNYRNKQNNMMQVKRVAEHRSRTDDTVRLLEKKNHRLSGGEKTKKEQVSGETPKHPVVCIH